MPDSSASERADDPREDTREDRVGDDRLRKAHKARLVLDRSASGAPAAGRAVRDRFSTDEIFQRLVHTADEEFSRPMRQLFLSGLAAGLAISFSFVGSAMLAGQTGSLALGHLMYPLGFVIVVVGRYQLFTENTLTPVTLVLTRIASVPLLLKVWGVVLLANVIGAALMALLLAHAGIFTPEAAEAALKLGVPQMDPAFGTLFWKGVLAGALVAGMVWLGHAVRSDTARVLIILLLIYPVAAMGLAHCVVGSAEVLYVVFEGQATLGAFFGSFFVPAVLGNTAGGVVLVAILNYAQTSRQRFPNRDVGELELAWREWLIGRHTGRAAIPAKKSTSTGEASTRGARPQPPSGGTEEKM